MTTEELIAGVERRRELIERKTRARRLAVVFFMGWLTALAVAMWLVLAGASATVVDIIVLLGATCTVGCAYHLGAYEVCRTALSDTGRTAR